MSEMSEMKRGYPNPNVTDADFIPEPAAVDAEILLDDEYIKYIQKAAALDILTNFVKVTGKIDNDVVRAVTGTMSDESKKDADIFWGYYVQEKAKTEKLEQRIQTLEHARKELIAILEQNGLVNTAEPIEAEVKKDGAD